jgi:hypothetical protein
MHMQSSDCIDALWCGHYGADYVRKYAMLGAPKDSDACQEPSRKASKSDNTPCSSTPPGAGVCEAAQLTHGSSERADNAQQSSEMGAVGDEDDELLGLLSDTDEDA